MEEHSQFFGEWRGTWVRIGPLVNGDLCRWVWNCLPSRDSWISGSLPPGQRILQSRAPDALTCWIALDASTKENGCVYYARGQPRTGLRRHKPSGVTGNSMTVAQPPEGEFEEVPGILPRGGAILHHCLLLHRSERNLSRAHGVDCCWYFEAATARWTRTAHRPTKPWSPTLAAQQT